MTYSIVANVALSTILLYAAVKAILRKSFFKTKIDICIFSWIVATLSAVTLVLQRLALNKIEGTGGICDHHYSVLEDWFQKKYSFSPDHIELFYECTIGSDGQRVVYSMLLSTAMIVAEVLSAVCITVEFHYEKMKAMMFIEDGLTVCEEDDDKDTDEVSIDHKETETTDMGIVFISSV